ncbi:hypothetical protein ACFE04_001726 [Oxalis oulophora]
MAIAYPHLIGSPPPMGSPAAIKILTQDDLKKIAAYKAIEHVELGMVTTTAQKTSRRHSTDLHRCRPNPFELESSKHKLFGSIQNTLAGSHLLWGGHPILD